MILVFIFLGIIIFFVIINLILMLSTLRLKIENLKIGRLIKDKRRI